MLVEKLSRSVRSPFVGFVFVSDKSTDKPYSLDSEDDFRSGCRNVSHQQQFFSETTLTRTITQYELLNVLYDNLYTWSPSILRGRAPTCCVSFPENKRWYDFVLMAPEAKRVNIIDIFIIEGYQCNCLPPFSLIRDFRKQNIRGNVCKISVHHTCYPQIGSKSTNHCPLA